jgi:RND family efflux transporter MFP subunit
MPLTRNEIRNLAPEFFRKGAQEESVVRRCIVSLLGLSCLYGAITPEASAANSHSGEVITVHEQTLTNSLRAFGQIEPIALLELHALEPGTLRGLHVVPGSAVTAGEVLGRVGGPRMRSLLTARQAALHSARVREDTASRTLSIARRQLSAQLGTQQAVDAAQDELAAAQAAVQTARAQLQETQDAQTLRAPATGTVVALRAADGGQTTPGDTILTLLPAGRLWISAAYYGADAALLHTGMRGRFQPAGGGDAIPVKVESIAPGMGADGGRRVGLVPVAAAAISSWVSGQWGTVTLEGSSREMVAVPTTALILDRGTWWVLVHTKQGNHPQKVIPGPTQGWETWIASGLQPGQQVITQNAFLEFHRGIARSYQPPD